MAETPKSIRIGPELTEKIEQLAQREHRKFAQMVRVLLEEAVEARKKKEESSRVGN